MIYEGAVIRRLVTPQHPGDPTLDDPAAEIQCRVEYVRDDATAPAPGSWTREISEAHRYPRHLDADHRARELSPHCFARVVPRENEEDLITQDGEAVSRLAHNQKIVGSTPTPATNLPAEEGSSSGRAPEQLPRVVPKVETRLGGTRAAGKTTSRKRSTSNRGRLAAIRLAAKRVQNQEAKPPGRHWWQEGQYA